VCIRTTNQSLLWALVPITLIFSVGIWWAGINWDPFYKLIAYISHPFGSSSSAVGSLLILLLAFFPMAIHGNLIRIARKNREAMTDDLHCPSCGYATWASSVSLEDKCPECGTVRPK